MGGDCVHLERILENLGEKVHGGGNSVLIKFMGLQGQSSEIRDFLSEKMGSNINRKTLKEQSVEDKIGLIII